MTIGDKYRFKISVPTFGIVEVFPVNSTLAWKFEKGEDLDSYTKELEDALIFVDDTSKLVGPLQPRRDFSYIYAIERARNRCLKVQIFIEKRCDTTSPFVPYWNGYFTMRDCKFDVEKCNVEVKPKQNITEDCFLDEWDREQNFLVGDSVITDPGYTGQLFEGICNESIVGFLGQYQFVGAIPYAVCLPVGDPSLGWTVLTNIGVFTANVYGGTEGIWYITTTYIREVLESPTDPGPPWVNIGTDLWARVPALSPGTFIASSANFSYIFTTIYPDGGYTNGRLLSEVMIELVESACPGTQFVSNFLNINPDGSEPANQFYTDAALYLSRLVLFPAHDQAKNDEIQASFRIDAWSLKDLIEDLQNMFNLKLFFDGTKYLLEHLSYGASLAGIDLTTDANKKYISGKWNYTYDKSKLFKKEIWVFPFAITTHATLRNDFVPVPIRYSQNCLDKATSSKTVSIQILFTSFDNVFGNESLIGSHLFILTSVDSNDKISIENGYFSVQPQLNGRLGFPWLAKMFWTYGRPLPNGELNFAQTNFTGLEKIRKQDSISVHMCCDDFDTLFDPAGLVRTQLGDGEIDDATYEEPFERLTLNLKHD